MKKTYFLQKKLSKFILLQRFLLRVYRLVFTKRTILFVTNEKIRSITLGPLSQACFFLFIAWVTNLFIQSLRYDEIIRVESGKVSELKSVNSYFQDQFENINDKLKKVNEYLISTTGDVDKVDVSGESNFKKPKSFREGKLSEYDKHTLNQIKNAEHQFDSIQYITHNRAEEIESAIAITGLNIRKISLQKKSIKKSGKPYKTLSFTYKIRALKNNDSYGQGGPLEEDSMLDAALESISLPGKEGYAERYMQTVKFNSEIDYLMLLEKLAKVMPLSRPMKNHYISSGFGRRIDPLTGKYAMHRGLDFVGALREEVISPSRGKVILAGRFSDYGKAIVIDHGFGITTRYGHLSVVKVRSGQIVNKGDIIGLQGSTGRSTGPHLHYEVRYKKIPLNPRKFIKAGDTLFNNKKVKYATS